MSYFNDLTPEEHERLALAMEEMGEAVQAIGKIFRHGLASYHPNDPSGPDNRCRLEKELGDIRYAVELLCVAGDVNRLSLIDHARAKARSVRQYLHHQDEKLLDAVAERYEP